MSGLSLFPVFMIGVLGSVHCVGMCGGIVGAISSASSKKFPVPVVTVSDENAGLTYPTSYPISHTSLFLNTVSYNVGRISSYAMAGAIVGGASQGARLLFGMPAMQMGGYWLANVMLIALGLYLVGVLPGLAYLEYAGHRLWRHIQPLVKRVMPFDSPWKLFVAGMLWGWLPCGMVYSMLLTAMLSGSAFSGAMVMLTFGLGTLPMLMAMGLLGAKLNTWTRYRAVRVVGGLVIVGFGVLGLIRAGQGIHASWLDTFCLAPSPTTMEVRP